MSTLIERLGGVVKKIEILPYHTKEVFKYEKLNVLYQLQDVESPGEGSIVNANSVLKVIS